VEDYILSEEPKYGPFFIIPAGRGDMDLYHEKLSRVDFSLPNSDEALCDLLRRAERYCRPDVILVDARTGLTDVGGVLVHGLADFVVALAYPDYQTADGLGYLFKRVPAPQELVRKALRQAMGAGREEQAEAWYNALSESAKIAFILHHPDLRSVMREYGPLRVWRDAFSRSQQAQYLAALEPVELLIEAARRRAPATPGSAFDERQGDGLSERSSGLAEILAELKRDPVSSDGKSGPDEFASTELILKNFLPRNQYRFLFRASQFLILGEKGTGKTALQRVLKNKDYTRRLAAYLGESVIEENQYWVTAMDDTPPLSPAQFGAIKAQRNDLDQFWTAYAVWLLECAKLDSWSIPHADLVIERMLEAGILERVAREGDEARLAFPEIYRVGLKVPKPNGIPTP
jgi:hypothetical protein